jgi:hypothetical protein
VRNVLHPPTQWMTGAFHAAGAMALCASAGIDLRASLDRAASGRQSFAGRRDIDIPILDFFPADPIAAEGHAKARHRTRRRPTLIRMPVQQ